MSKIGLHAWVSGHVQGVWFRQSTKEQAESNGVSGWAKNHPDGRVEVLLYGEANAVHLVEAWLSQGPPLATVAEVVSEEVTLTEVPEGFSVG